jgi:DNA-binding MarR family transcriptional regulator
MTKNNFNKEKSIFQIMTNISFVERKHKNEVNEIFIDQKITSSQGLLLIYLYMLDSPTETTQIARYLSLNKSSITHLKQMLLDLQLIEQNTDPKDKRKSLIKINPKGEKIAKSLFQKLKTSSFYKVLEDLNKNDLDSFKEKLLNITKSGFDNQENFTAFLSKIDDHFSSSTSPS